MTETQNTKPNLALVSIAVCGLAALTTAALMYKVTENMAARETWIIVLPVVPYLIFAGISWAFRKTRSSSAVMLAGTLLLTLVGLYLIFDVFVFSGPHAKEEGLIVLIVPICQILGAIVLTFVAFIAKLISKNTPRREATSE